MVRGNGTGGVESTSNHRSFFSVSIFFGIEIFDLTKYLKFLVQTLNQVFLGRFRFDFWIQVKCLARQTYRNCETFKLWWIADSHKLPADCSSVL